MKEMNDITGLLNDMNTKSVCLMFYGNNCPACKQLEQVIKLIEPFHPHIKFYKLNIEEHPFLGRQFAVMSLPTTIFIQDGKTIAQEIGAVSKNTLAHHLNYLEEA